MKTPNPIKSLAGQTVVYGMGTIVPRLLNYMLVPVYTRVFHDQATYGQITELYAYIAFLMVLLTYGMETAFFRYAQKGDKQQVFNNAMSAILLTTGIFVLLSLLLYKKFAGWMQYSGNSEYILLVVFIVAFDAITAIPFAMLRKLNQARRFAIIRLINVAFTLLLNFCAIIYFPIFFGDLAIRLLGQETSLVVWVFIANLLASLLSLLMLGSVFRHFKFVIEWEILKPMLRYAWPVLIIGLAGMVNEMLDKVLLKYLLNDKTNAMAELGIYGANYKLGVLMTLFIQMFRYAAEPFFFAEAEKKQAQALFARVMNYFLIAGLIIFLGVTLYLDIFKHFIGEAYRDGLFIVPIILIANLFNGVYYNLAIWYKLTDRTLSGAVIALFGALITIGLNFWLIPIYGYLGAAWTHLITYFLMMTLSYVWGQRVYPVPYQPGRLIFYTVLAFLLYYISLYFKGLQPLSMYLFNTALLVVFLIIVFLIERKSASGINTSGL